MDLVFHVLQQHEGQGQIAHTGQADQAHGAQTVLMGSVPARR